MFTLVKHRNAFKNGIKEINQDDIKDDELTELTEEEPNKSIYKSVSQGILIDEIRLKHSKRRSQLVHRNASKNEELLPCGPKGFTFEGSEERSNNSRTSEKRKDDSKSKDQNMIRWIQTIFLYDPQKLDTSNLNILKDESNKHLNMPPSPRFGDLSLSFGNDYDGKNYGSTYYFETE